MFGPLRNWNAGSCLGLIELNAILAGFIVSKKGDFYEKKVERT